MDDNQLREFLRHSVSRMETHNYDPYKLQDAKIGTSGYSFGHFQNDISSNNKIAADTFSEIMNTQVKSGKFTQEQVDGIILRAEHKSLNSTDRNDINNALAENKNLIDQADSQQLDLTVTQVKASFAAAEKNPNGPGELNRQSPNLKFITELGAWSNASNGLATTNKYISNANVITKESFDKDYLSVQGQFKNHKDFAEHWPGRINDATHYAISKTNVNSNIATGTNQQQNISIQSPHLAAVVSHLKSSGFSDQPQPAQIDKEALMKQLQQSIQNLDNATAATKSAPPAHSQNLNIQTQAR